MKLKVLLILAVFLCALAIGIVFSNTDTIFFDTVPWIIFSIGGLGLICGVIRALFKEKEEISHGEINRHGGGSFLEHWGTALGIFALLASGLLLGFLFFPEIMKHADETAFPLNIHFIGVVITLFGGFFFIGDYIASRKFSRLIPNIPDIFGGFFGKYFLRRKWSAEDKYLSSQKVAFLGFAAIGGVILISGAIKVINRIWPIDADYLNFFTYTHDLFSLFFIFLLIVHMLLVLALREWPALISWVTGKISKEHVEKDYPVWYKELTTGKQRVYRLFSYKEVGESED